MPTDQINAALAAFRQYTDAFQALDAKAAARHFHEPAMLIAPPGVVTFPNVAAVEQAYQKIIAELPSDYARTEFSPLTGHRLGDDLVLVTGRGTWKNTADQDIMPFGMTYTLRRANGDWRIIVATVHAPDGGPGR